MPMVKVRSHEPFEVALRRFKRSCEKAGIVTEVRARETYEKPTEERKRKKAAAVKRTLKKIFRETPRTRDERAKMKKEREAKGFKWKRNSDSRH